MNIGIAGAGLCGRLLGWQLLRGGHAVTLFDRDASGAQSAGHIAAAMLAPYSEAVTVGPEVLEPGLAALEQWPRWLELLAEHSSREVPLRIDGSLVVAHSGDRADLHWFHRRLRGLETEIQGDSWWLQREQVALLEPALKEFSEALLLPREGWVDNRALYLALGDAIDALGGRWQVGREILVVAAGQIRCAGGEERFDLVLDCRGFGARQQLENFRGVRGELLRVRAPEVRLGRPVRLMHPRYQLYVVPRPAGVYIIGATEIESESMAPVTVRSSLELLSALYTLHSGFAEAEVLEASAHCRPAFADNLPRIIQREGLLQVNGLYRHGFLLAPALVSSVLAAIEGSEVCPPIQLEHYREPPGQVAKEPNR
ncbi:FAD-dependent oxidoreductase [Haliea sp. E17]|uniref:FAD-dependent oxidoreductase n=1 Tax=Haliea sp. E17 TaxID=3401576 RepID=UPI003AAD942D